MKEWYNKLTPPTENTEQKLLIEDDEEIDEDDMDYSAEEDAHNNLINEIRRLGLDEMDDIDPYWRIANDIG